MRTIRVLSGLLMALVVLLALVNAVRAYDGEGEGPNPMDSYPEGTTVQCYESIAANDGTKLLGCTLTERDSFFFLLKDAAKVEGSVYTFFVSTQTNVKADLSGSFETGKYVAAHITHKGTYSERPTPATSPAATTSPVVTTTPAGTPTAEAPVQIVKPTATPKTTEQPKPTSTPRPTHTPEAQHSTPAPTEEPVRCVLVSHLDESYGWQR